MDSKNSILGKEDLKKNIKGIWYTKEGNVDYE